MSQSGRSQGRLSAGLRRFGASRIAVWLAFTAAHLWLGLLNLYAPGLPLGDVTFVYKFWVDQAIYADFWVGIDSLWVYPIVAIVPMLVAGLFGASYYASTWLTMILVLDAIAFAVLTGWRQTGRNTAIGWWWVAFLVLLGPIALGRIDSVTVPIAIIGVLLVASRPRVSAVLLALATWIKVWPAALLAAIVVASRDRWRFVSGAAVTSAAVLAAALLLGSGSNVFSFFTEQSGRGLQVESPVSTLWLWQAFFGVPGTFVYYDQQILTWQVEGAGVDVAGWLMTPLLGLVAVALCLVGMLALQRGVPAHRVLPPLALALVTGLIAFNKVGSPQFMTWLAVPVILGLVAGRTPGGVSFRVPAGLVLLLAALTQLVYPYLYHELLGLNPAMLVVLTVRNALLFVLLGWAIAALLRGGSNIESAQPGAASARTGDAAKPEAGTGFSTGRRTVVRPE